MDVRTGKRPAIGVRAALVAIALLSIGGSERAARAQEVPADVRERVVAALSTIGRAESRAREATGRFAPLSAVLSDPEVAGAYQAVSAYYSFEERGGPGGRFLVLAVPRSGVAGPTFTLRQDLRVRQLAERRRARTPRGVRPASPAEAGAVLVLTALAAAENACYEATGRYQGLPELVAGGFLEEPYLEPGALAPGYRFYLTAASWESYRGWKAEPLPGYQGLRALWISKDLRVTVEGGR